MGDPNATRRWGVTDPISIAGPTTKDVELSAKLEALLREMKQFEPPEESQEREEALGHINLLVKEWVHKVSLKKVGVFFFSCGSLFYAHAVPSFYFFQNIGSN